MNSSQNLSLGEAASRFLASLPPPERAVSQQEIYRFVRWYGWERPLAGLTPPEVASYAERLSLSDTDYLKKLELVRAFLIHAKKEGWSQSNLSIHLKARKGKTPPKLVSRRGSPETVALTQQGYAKLEAELNTLKNKRHEVIDEMRRAAADKDFRENAPLEAAREQHGQIVGRIKELEEALKSASVIDEQPRATLNISIGDRIVLADPVSGQERRYTLVSPREVDPARGKISTSSPIGKAVLGRGEGEMVEVTTPAGKFRYQIIQVER